MKDRSFVMKFYLYFTRNKQSNGKITLQKTKKCELENIKNKLQSTEQTVIRRDNLIAQLYSDLYAREAELSAASERICEFQQQTIANKKE